MFGSLKRRKQQRLRAEALYDACVVQARSPEFYAGMGVPDTIDGRFELIALHVGLLIRRLNREGETGKAVAQDVFDAMFRDFDSGLREMAIGDASIGKNIKAMASAFYGRVKAYDDALAEQDAAALGDALKRNVFATGEGDGSPEALAAYIVAAQEALDGQDGDAVMFTQSPEFPPVAVSAGA